MYSSTSTRGDGQQLGVNAVVASSQTLAPEPLNLDIEGVTVSAANLYNPFGRDFASWEVLTRAYARGAA